MQPTLNNLVKQLIGKTAQADHPITVLNPDLYFTIYEARIDDNKVSCRGKNTMWFDESLLTVLNNYKAEV